MAYESTKIGNADPVDWHKTEIEHILPESPKKWGFPWYGKPKPTDNNQCLGPHKFCKELLGNKLLLEKSANRHVKNEVLDEKRVRANCMSPEDPHPAGVCNGMHYDDSKIKSATGHAAAYPNWDQSDIEDRTKNMIEAIIGAFDTF